MDEIIDGVRRFQRDVYPKNWELFERLARGQSPHTMMISCSDSRVDCNLLTQTTPGQIFELRNAGNLVPLYDGRIGGVTATIEFAVVGLGVSNIIICGHSGCGAMAGLLNPAQLQGMPRVAEWLKHAQIVRETMAASGQLDAPDALQRAVEANVIVQLDHLRSQPSVDERLRAGRIQLHGWVYHIGTGEVTTYDPESRRFVPI